MTALRDMTDAQLRDELAAALLARWRLCYGHPPRPAQRSVWRALTDRATEIEAHVVSRARGDYPAPT